MFVLRSQIQARLVKGSGYRPNLPRSVEASPQHVEKKPEPSRNHLFGMLRRDSLGFEPHQTRDEWSWE
jgi:hypothetical protein